jgi:hypothetical protein
MSEQTQSIIPGDPFSGCGLAKSVTANPDHWDWDMIAMRNEVPSRHIVYLCPVCERGYATYTKADQCIKSTPDRPTFTIGNYYMHRLWIGRPLKLLDLLPHKHRWYGVFPKCPDYIHGGVRQDVPRSKTMPFAWLYPIGNLKDWTEDDLVEGY